MATRSHAAGDEDPAAHAVFFPFPAQGHVAPALHLARLVHARGGVRVTFVHTERNRRRLLRSRGPHALAGAPGFAFAFVPDGLPPPSGEGDDDDHSPEHIAALLAFISGSVPHLGTVLDAAAAAGSPATCVVSDIESVLDATRETFGVPAVAFWTTGACGLMSSLLCQQLIDRGLVPLKDEEQLRNGYLDTVIDWAPGMPADMRLRDFVSFIRTTDPDDALLRFVLHMMDSVRTAPCAVVLNTFDELEARVVGAMSSMLPPIYTVGPLPLLTAQSSSLSSGDGGPLARRSASLNKEDDGCLAWLGTRRPRSVMYANFGSIAVLTSRQLREFAWGLARSGHDFLLVVRKDQAKDSGGLAAVLTPEFVEEAGGRAYVASWCPQDQVLRHVAVGAFLTHCGWNSVLEGICAGVPMLCWPVAADQQTNCRFACTEWRVGVEVPADVDRTEVAELVREVMGERGREVRRRAAEWKEKAAAAAAAALPGGPAWVNLERLVNKVFRRSM